MDPEPGNAPSTAPSRKPNWLQTTLAWQIWEWTAETKWKLDTLASPASHWFESYNKIGNMIIAIVNTRTRTRNHVREPWHRKQDHRHGREQTNQQTEQSRTKANNSPKKQTKTRETCGKHIDKKHLKKNPYHQKLPRTKTAATALNNDTIWHPFVNT